MKMQRKLHSTRSSSTGAVQETKHPLCEGKAASKWQTIRHLMGAGMIFSMTLLLCSVATATPAPGTYEKLQANAEEVLRVRIINVGREASERIDPRSYTVQARVLAVFRSKSGLRRGDVVEFANYVTPRDTKRTCSASPPLVMKFWTGRVYLNAPSNVHQVSNVTGEEQSFEVAAHSKSLESGPLSWAVFSQRFPSRSQIRYRLPAR